jgi:hypothetical protein
MLIMYENIICVDSLKMIPCGLKHVRILSVILYCTCKYRRKNIVRFLVEYSELVINIARKEQHKTPLTLSH